MKMIYERYSSKKMSSDFKLSDLIIESVLLMINWFIFSLNLLRYENIVTLQYCLDCKVIDRKLLDCYVAILTLFSFAQHLKI